MISYSRYSSGLKGDVVALLDRHWAWSDLDKSRIFFEWRYEDNPYTESPCIFVAKDGDKVIGLRCYVVQEFRRASDAVLMACPADAIVHPDYRRKGIFGALTEYSLDQHIAHGVRIVLSLSANRASAAANKKLGWIEFGMAKYLYKVGVAGLYGSDNRSPKRTERGPFTIDISTTTHPEKPPTCRHPEISGTQFANVRDDSYYAWRYREPFAQYYFVSAQGNHQKGYAILKKVGHRRAFLMEYGVDAAPVLDAMMSEFTRTTGTILLRMLDLTLTRSEVAVFRKAGFFYEPGSMARLFNKYRGGALVRLVPPDTASSGGLRETEVVGENNWHIVPADIH